MAPCSLGRGRFVVRLGLRFRRIGIGLRLGLRGRFGVLLQRRLARGRLVIALAHAFADERLSLGTLELLVVSADDAGLHLLLGGDGDSRRGRQQKGNQGEESRLARHGSVSFEVARVLHAPYHGMRRPCQRSAAAMLPPSTVVTPAVVLSARACARKAWATSSAVTSRRSRLPLI